MKQEKKVGALENQGLLVCGKQDLKLLLYDFRFSSMLLDRLISMLPRF